MSNTHRRIQNTSSSGLIDEALMRAELPALWVDEPPLELPGSSASTLKKPSPSKLSPPKTASTSASARASSTAKPKPSPPSKLPTLTKASLAQAALPQLSPSSRPGPASDVDSEVGSLPEVAESKHHQPRPTSKPSGLNRSATRAEDILKPPPFQQYYGTTSSIRPKAFFQAADSHKVLPPWAQHQSILPV
jgi:hypothetical protein